MVLEIIVAIVIGAGFYFLGRRDGKRSEKRGLAQNKEINRGQTSEINQHMTRLMEKAFPETDFSTAENQKFIATATAASLTALSTYTTAHGDSVFPVESVPFSGEAPNAYVTIRSGGWVDNTEPAVMTHGAPYVGSEVPEGGYPVGAHSSTDAKPDGRIILVNPDPENLCSCGSGKKYKDCHGKEGP